MSYHFASVIGLDGRRLANRLHDLNRMRLRRFSAIHRFDYYYPDAVHYSGYYYSMMWRYLTMSYRLWCADDADYLLTNYFGAANWLAWPMALLWLSYK